MYCKKATIRNWYAKFKTGNRSLTNEHQGRPGTVVDNDVLRSIVEKKKKKNSLLEIMVRGAVRDYAELGVSPTTISRNLKLISKVKKMDKWVPHELNEQGS